MDFVLQVEDCSPKATVLIVILYQDTVLAAILHSPLQTAS